MISCSYALIRVVEKISFNNNNIKNKLNIIKEGVEGN